MTTSRFGVQVSSRQGVQQLLPPELTFAPKRWSWSCVGGPKAAEIAVTGGRDALKGLRQWLRYPVKIVAPTGTVVWWGYIHEVELQLGGLTIVASLDNLRNRVKVLYTATSAGGGATDTGWLDDTISEAEYGYKEHVESLGDASAGMATTLRARLLADGVNPKLKRSLASNSTTTAILRCRGWYQRLGWRYYQRVDGRVENMPTGGSTVEQPIGWGLASSSNVGIGDNALFAVGDYFNYFSEGHRLVVTGCTVSANNQTYTVAGSTSDEVVTHTHTLSFSIDDIDDPAGDLDGFKPEYWVWVSGSVQNDRFHWIGKADKDHIEIKDQIAGELDPEGPTSNVTLTQPQKLSVSETNYTEDPTTAAKTIVHKGQRVAQKVTLATGMYVDAIQLELGKVGAPADNFNIQIYTDVAGTPTTLKTSGAIAGTALTTDVEAMWVPLTKVWLAAGSYWIIVWRSSTLSATAHYLVGMTDTAYLTTMMWDGAVWSTMAPVWSLKFRLWGVDDIGTLIEAIVTSAAQNITLSSGYTASVDGWTYMEDAATGLDEIERLVKIGDSSGNRIVVDVSQDLALRLSSKPNAVTVPNLALYTATGKQRLTDVAGTDIEPGANVASQWVRLADLDSDLAAEGGLSPAWIEEAEFDATNKAWALTFEGERSLADIIKVQQG